MAYNSSYGMVALYNGSSYTKIDGFIQRDTLTISPNMRQDKDSYRNGKGVLRRTVLEHYATKIEFDTKNMSNTDFDSFMEIFSNAITSQNYRHKMSRVRYYNAITRDYQTGTFYTPDIEIKYAGILNSKPMVLPTRIAFIEY